MLVLLTLFYFIYLILHVKIYILLQSNVMKRRIIHLKDFSKNAADVLEIYVK